MNTKALNSLAELICRTQEQDRTPMGIAFAIESAGRHMSPEVAAELVSLRGRVAELEAERHSTNEALDDAVQELRTGRTAMVCRMCEAPVRWVEPKLLNGGWWAHVSPAVDGHGISPKPFVDPCRPCGCPKRFERHADGCPATAAEEDVTPQVMKLRTLLAGQRDAVDGEHYPAVHHAYRVPRDLPPLGGQR